MTIQVQSETLNFIRGADCVVSLLALRFCGRRVGYRVTVEYPAEPHFNFHEDRRTRKLADANFRCWKQRALINT